MCMSDLTDMCVSISMRAAGPRASRYISVNVLRGHNEISLFIVVIVTTMNIIMVTLICGVIRTSC